MDTSTDVRGSVLGGLNCNLQATSAGLTSLRSSVLKYQEENGRTYHAMSSGSTSPVSCGKSSEEEADSLLPEYYIPNDERERERLGRYSGLSNALSTCCQLSAR